MPIDSIEAGGTSQLGVQNVGISGIFTRGVLVDMPRNLGIDYLPAGTVITSSDIERWEQVSGVTIKSADVLLIRTGRWAQVEEQGQWDFREKAAALTPR